LGKFSGIKSRLIFVCRKPKIGELFVSAKDTQPIALWFLFVVIFGGVIWPALGLLVLGFMIFFLVLAYFRGRYWCANLCPRGAFLDLWLSKISAGKPLNNFLTRPKTRWLIFVLFMAFFAWQIIAAPKNPVGIGFVFVRMCLITTLIAIFIGLPWKARAWCAVCPMGTLQGKISTLRRKYGGKKS
jgi:polyferredoxin